MMLKWTRSNVQKRQWGKNAHHGKKKLVFEPVGNVLIDLKNRHCFFPVDIAGYENRHLVVAIFCSQKINHSYFVLKAMQTSFEYCFFFFSFFLRLVWHHTGLNKQGKTKIPVSWWKNFFFFFKPPLSPTCDGSAYICGTTLDSFTWRFYFIIYISK